MVTPSGAADLDRPRLMRTHRPQFSRFQGGMDTLGAGDKAKRSETMVGRRVSDSGGAVSLLPG